MQLSTTLKLAALGAVLAGACRGPTENDRTVVESTRASVLGGTAAEPGAHPWQARFADGRCGGALVGTRWVLTAAHCVVDYHDGTPHYGDAASLEVVLGDHDMVAKNGPLDAEQRRTARAITPHEAFFPRGATTADFDYDIALIELRSPVELGPRVTPIALPTADDDPAVGSVVTLAGWGRTVFDDPSSRPDVLREVSATIAAVGERALLTERGVSGPGDSGGPLVFVTDAGPRVAGVTAFSARFTRVSRYRDWLTSLMRERSWLPVAGKVTAPDGAELTSRLHVTNPAPVAQDVVVAFHGPSGARLDETALALGPGETAEVRGAECAAGAVIESARRVDVVVTTDGSASPGRPAILGATAPTQRPSSELRATLFMKRTATASGLASTTLFVQNAAGAPADYRVDFGGTSCTLSGSIATDGLVVLASDAIDCLPDGYAGTATVRDAGGALVGFVYRWVRRGRLQNLQTAELLAPSRSSRWFVPLLMSRLETATGNGLSVPLTIMSETPVDEGDVVIRCHDEAGRRWFSRSSPALAAGAFWDLNPVTDTTIEGNRYGACTITGSKPLLTNVQLRYVDAERPSDLRAASHDAIAAYAGPPASAYEVTVPWAPKNETSCGGARPCFASSITVQSVAEAETGTITLEYYRHRRGEARVLEVARSIGPGEQIIQNLRLPGAVAVPDGATYMVRVRASVPFGVVVQVEDRTAGDGDGYAAYGIPALPVLEATR